MKSGYQAELSARKDELEQDKLELESLYMAPTKEEDIQASDEQKQKHQSLFSKVETHVANLQTTLKSVKLAIDFRPL
jgi:hypothetical protein